MVVSRSVAAVESTVRRYDTACNTLLTITAQLTEPQLHPELQLLAIYAAVKAAGCHL
jgi:hypothetical protein